LCSSAYAAQFVPAIQGLVRNVKDNREQGRDAEKMLFVFCPDRKHFLSRELLSQRKCALLSASS
jgi:hypothetical protein